MTAQNRQKLHLHFDMHIILNKLRKFQENRVRNGVRNGERRIEKIDSREIESETVKSLEALNRNTARHLFRSSHLKYFQYRID